MQIIADKKSFVNPKLIAIGAVISAAGFVMSRMIAAVAAQADISGVLVLAGVTALFLALWGIQSLAVASRKTLIALGIVESLAVIAPFVPNASFAGLAIVVVGAIMLVMSGLRGQKDAGASLKVYFGKTMRATAPLAISALALLFSYAYTATITGADLQVSRKGFDALVAPLTGTARGFIPGFDITMSVNKLMEAVALSDLPQLPAELRAMPREAKLQLIAQSRSDILNMVSDKLGVAVLGGDVVGDALYRAAKNKLLQVPERWHAPVIVGFGALVFLSVKSVAFIINYLAAAIAWLLFQLLLATGFIIIGLENVSKEIVVL